MAMKKVFVIAGNHKEFVAYIGDKAKVHGSGAMINSVRYEYVFTMQQLHKGPGVSAVYIGTYESRKDLDLELIKKVLPA